MPLPAAARSIQILESFLSLYGKPGDEVPMAGEKCATLIFPAVQFASHSVDEVIQLFRFQKLPS
jgi:hypothetical protein